MLNLNELEVFIAAAEHGSFSEAARRMHLSQPAVSQCIQTLERRFQLELFTRQGKSARLSDAGKTLLPLARELVTSAVRLKETMCSLSGVIAGHIQVGCSSESGKYLMPTVMARFRQHFPTVRVDIHTDSRERMINRLVENRLDFAVSSKLIDHHDLDGLAFFEDELVLIVPSNHVWARSGLIFPNNLMDAPVIMCELTSATYEAVYHALLAHDIPLERLHVVMVSGSAEATALSVEKGIGVAFISRLAAAHSIALGRVVAVRVEGLDLRVPLYFLRNQRVPLTPAQKALWDFVRTQGTLNCQEDRPHS